MTRKPNRKALRVTIAVRVTPMVSKAFIAKARKCGNTPSQVMRELIGAYADDRVIVNKEHSQ